MAEVIPIPHIAPNLSDYQKTFLLKVRAYLESLTGFSITDSYIFQLVLEHHGVINVPRMTVQIGSRFDENGPIAAIFEIKGWFMICTRTMGALTGSPRYIDGKDVVEVVEFKKNGLLQPKTHKD
jgi:hypothetical protein